MKRCEAQNEKRRSPKSKRGSGESQIKKGAQGNPKLKKGSKRGTYFLKEAPYTIFRPYI
jgi:hypothetical protein